MGEATNNLRFWKKSSTSL